MNNSLIELSRKWVSDIYFNANHLLRTGYWIEQLHPKADDALIIAAITHDIERAFPKGRKPPSPKLKGAKWGDRARNEWHGKRSAKFVRIFLNRNGAPKHLIDKVVKLVSHHERGGQKETNWLRDADSISFLETNVPFFISRIPKELNKEGVKEKFEYMFRRIGSNKARLIAKPFYKKALASLKTLKD